VKKAQELRALYRIILADERNEAVSNGPLSVSGSVAQRVS